MRRDLESLAIFHCINIAHDLYSLELDQLVYCSTSIGFLNANYSIAVTNLTDWFALFVIMYRSTSFQGRLLKHNLDAEVVDALKDLRQKLSEKELK